MRIGFQFIKRYENKAVLVNGLVSRSARPDNRERFYIGHAQGLK
jgi:hypothetical protein